MGEGHSHGKYCCCCHDQQDSCCQEHHHMEESDECGMSSFFIEAADAAWMEVLKDKMKEYILSTHGDKMMELAKIVADANSQRWKNKMDKKQGCADFEEKLCRFFGQSKK